MNANEIKLEDMITLQIVSSDSVAQAVKKMVHVPTMKVYMVKELPISNRET